MWGRSIPYRFRCRRAARVVRMMKKPRTSITDGCAASLPPPCCNFAEPDFLEDNVPTLGFYGTFAPAVQIYSCRGSVYWCGKAFLSLLLPADNPFWTAVENNGPWEKEFKKKTMCTTNSSPQRICSSPTIRIAEGRKCVRKCHETVANDWQKFRSSENYNKLAYHTEFPWMADGRTEKFP